MIPKTSSIKFHLEIQTVSLIGGQEVMADELKSKTEVKDEKEIDERSRYVM